MIILGIDPGFGRMGYGVISEEKGKIEVKDFGCFETKKTASQENRLLELKKAIDKLIKKNRPDTVVVESLFFSKNVKTALRVGEARGVILLAIAEAGINCVELSPQQVKQAVTGYGAAEKSQVGRMVAKILNLSSVPSPDDAADALALAIAGAQITEFLNSLH